MDGLKGLVLSQIELTLIQNFLKIMYAQNSKNQTYLLQDLVMYICVQTVKPKEKKSNENIFLHTKHHVTSGKFNKSLFYGSWYASAIVGCS